MTAALFLAFVALIAITAGLMAARYLSRGIATGILIGLPAWLVYVGLLAYFGVVRNTTLRPPGIVYVLLPVFVFVLVYVVRSEASARAAFAIPLWALLAMQVYRVGVEMFLHQLWKESLVPRMVTFEGANLDILIGATAPLIAWLATRGDRGLRLAFLWNLLGLLSLANVATRSALTSPGPLRILHSDLPNLAIGMFPYTYIPGFLAPLAVVLHVLAIRSLRFTKQIASGRPRFMTA